MVIVSGLFLIIFVTRSIAQETSQSSPSIQVENQDFCISQVEWLSTNDQRDIQNVSSSNHFYYLTLFTLETFVISCTTFGLLIYYSRSHERRINNIISTIGANHNAIQGNNNTLINIGTQLTTMNNNINTLINTPRIVVTNPQTQYVIVSTN